MVVLTEKSKDNITLYRGDSSEVKQYLLGKADPDALVGRGIYLTSSFAVAKDYTIKGNQEGVVYKSEPNIDPREFLRQKFHKKLSGPQEIILRAFSTAIDDEVYRFSTIAQNEIDQTIGTGRDARQHPRYNELTSWLSLARSYCTAYLWKISQPVLFKHLRGLFDQTYVDFKKSFEGTRMLQTVLKELVVLRDDQIGQVARFRVPKNYLDRTYRVDDPMPGWLITWIARYSHDVTGQDISTKRVDLRYNDPTKGETHADNLGDWLDKFREHGMRYAWSKHNVGGNGENPSLLEFILGTHFGGMLQHQPVKENQKPLWDALIDFLITRGYKGFHYQGGRRTGGGHFAGGSPIKHDAYSLWIEKDIQGFRVSAKPLGLDGTDPRLFQRFRFDTTMNQLNQYFDYHTRPLKYRDDVANVAQIEDTAQAWLSSGALDKKLGVEL